MVQIQKRKCPICGEIFKPEHPNQKYCKPSEEKKCKLIARKRQIHINVQRHRRKHRNTQKEARYEAIGNATQEHGKAIMEQYQTGKGTGRLGPKPLPNFDDEHIKILKEFLRLRIPAPSLN